MLEPASDQDLAPPTPSRAMPTVRFGWLRSVLGLRRSFTVGGVKYKELTSEPLSRALSRRGSRSKDYAVSFPGGRRMRITVTPARAYEDLNGAALLDEYRLAAPFIRPGMRVVALRSGSGYAASWLAEMVGPSGAVVALDPDNEVIRYARWRYRLANVSFEVGDHTALTGEIDGAFDAALAVRALREGEDTGGVFGELWRVIAPGGSLIAIAPSIPDPADTARALSTDELIAALIAPATLQVAAHRASLDQADADPAPAPPAPPPNPEVRVLPALPSIAAVAIRKTPPTPA
jgi:SAM-dependent methyltransferase